MAQPYNDQEQCDEDYMAQSIDEYDSALTSIVARTTLTEQAMLYSPPIYPAVTISQSPEPTRRVLSVRQFSARQLTDAVADGTHADSVTELGVLPSPYNSEPYPGPKDMNTTFSEDLLESPAADDS
jgi:hypothetical protein